MPVQHAYRGARRNKYGAKRAQGRDARWYDSKAERDRGDELAALAEAGVIRGLVHQPRLELLPAIYYRPDFGYETDDGLVYEDVKGVETERFRLIRKLWALFGPAPLYVLKRQGRTRLWVPDRIVPHKRVGHYEQSSVIEERAIDLRIAALALAEAPRRTPTLTQAVRDAVTAFDAARDGLAS